MKKLQPDWFVQNQLDAEYQQYVVMAYLTAVQRNFSEYKLYPDLPELRDHYNAGLRFSRGKGTLNAAFPKRISGVSGRPPRIQYQTQQPDDEFMQELDAIMDFALPKFQEMLTEGQERWGTIAAELTLAPVGLLPLQAQEGYLLLHTVGQADMHIFQFRATLFSDTEPGGRLVRLRFVERTRKSLVNTLENIKLDLIRRHRDLPNPATFQLESRRAYPVQETLLPIARQLLAQAVA